MSKKRSIILCCLFSTLLLVSIKGYALLPPMGIIAISSNWGIWLTDHMNNFGRARSLFQSLSGGEIPASGNMVKLFQGPKDELSIACQGNTGFDGSEYLACDIKMGKNVPIEATFAEAKSHFSVSFSAVTSKQLYDKLRVKEVEYGGYKEKIASSNDKRVSINCSQHDSEKTTNHICSIQVAF